MNRNLANFQSESGFSLLESLIAISVLLVVLLGVFSVFTFAIVYNTGNNTRSQALSVLQREIELVRSYKFTPTITDAEMTGGEKAAKYVDAADGTSYKVVVKVDDDPSDSDIDTIAASTLKEITIIVTPANKVGDWQTAASTQVVMRRVRGN
jgi:prepilin-type N-terminal cleavage/methylation domain-containing protein